MVRIEGSACAAFGEVPRSVPSTFDHNHLQLQLLMILASTGTCTHVHIPSQDILVHIIKIIKMNFKSDTNNYKLFICERNWKPPMFCNCQKDTQTSHSFLRMDDVHLKRPDSKGQTPRGIVEK